MLFMDLISIYQTLLKTYGKQGWWPVTKENYLHPAYDDGPKNEKQQFEVMIGAILTQNTSWTNVGKAIFELNKHDLIDIDKIMEIDKEKLAELIRSAGYYNQKAEKLKIIAQFLKENPIKELEKIETEILREILLNIKGVGPETADSILLYAFNRPIFVVDAYTKRIFSRLEFFGEKASYDEVQKLFMENLEHDAKMFNEYHALIVCHAKQYYRKKSEHEKCFLG